MLAINLDGLVWRIADDSPNSPNFLPTKLSRYTVRIGTFARGCKE